MRPTLMSRGAFLAVLLTTLPPGCGEDDRLTRLQEQKEQAQQRAQAEREAKFAWITALSLGGCCGALVALLLGLHLGSQGLRKYRKERGAHG